MDLKRSSMSTIDDRFKELLDMDLGGPNALRSKLGNVRFFFEQVLTDSKIQTKE